MKNRKFLLVTSILGLILLILPWMIDPGMGSSYNGLKTLSWFAGSIYIFSFIALIYISRVGDKTKQIDFKNKQIAVVISIIAFGVISFRLITHGSYMYGIMNLNSLGFFALLLILSAPISFLIGWLFKSE